MTIEEAITCLDQLLAQHPDMSVLSDLQESVFRLCWEGQSYSKIAETLGYEPDYIKKVGVQLWKRLSNAFEKKVTKKNLHAVFRQYHDATQTAAPKASNVSQAFHDWGDAIHVHDFWGRDTELETLHHWVVGDDCHLICIVGQGGIGKTAIAVKLSEQLQNKFHCVIWRSLKQSPLCRNLLADILTAFPESQESLPDSVDIQIKCLIQHLKANRCLLILDNLESILQNGTEGGEYREQYQDYEHLLEQLSDGRHQSCVIVTSREKPMVLAMREGDVLAVRSLHLKGLSPSAGQNILNAKGLDTDRLDSAQIVNNYAGNPLALKVVASTIQSIFGGDTSLFLTQSVTVFGNIWDLLKQQLNRLSSLEKQVMYWLAINREWVTLVDLQDDVFPKVPQRDLITTLTSLQNRSLIETQTAGFTQQSVVMEYMTEELINVLENELIEQKLSLLISHAILKAQAKDYIRDIQIRLIIQPLLERLLSHFSHQKSLEVYLKTSLNQLRKQPLKEVGYAGGNLLNLLCQSNATLINEDLSYLNLWQSYLPQSNLSQVSLAHSNLDKSVFAEAFGGIPAVAFSPDGQLLATGDTAGGINLWQVRTGKKLTIYEGHRFWVWSLQFSPDGKKLLSTGDDYLVKLWDVNTDQCLKIFKGHELSVTSGVFSHSGDLIATCSQDSSIRIWTTGKQENSCIQILKGHVNRVWSVAYSPTEDLLVSAAEDNTIKLWNPLTGECLQTLEGHKNWVKSITFSPDGTLVASGSFDHTIKVWDIRTGECLTTLQGHSNTVTTVIFSPDGHHLASSSYDQTLKVWDLSNEECLNTFRGHTNRVWALTYTPDGTGLVSGGDDHAVKFWVAKTGRCTKTIQGHTNISLSVTVHPNLLYFASGHEDQTVRLWDYETGDLKRTLRGHTNRVWSVAFSPLNAAKSSFHQARTLASGSADGTIKLWDDETGECQQTLLGHKSWVWSVAFSPDAQCLASSSYDQTIKLWDVETGACLQTFRGHQGPVSSVIFSPSGKELISSSFDYTIKIWNIESGTCLKTLEGHTNNVWSIAFSPDGQTFASSSYDHTIKLWNYLTRDCLQTFQGHQGPVIPIHFTPDGSSLITGSYDRTIKLWNLQTGECQITLKGHTDVVVSLSFTSESLPILMSASFDETVKRWDLTTGTCLSTIRVPRPYENMNIVEVSGLTTAQITTLKALGAIEKEFIAPT